MSLLLPTKSQLASAQASKSSRKQQQESNDGTTNPTTAAAPPSASTSSSTLLLSRPVGSSHYADPCSSSKQQRMGYDDGYESDDNANATGAPQSCNNDNANDGQPAQKQFNLSPPPGTPSLLTSAPSSMHSAFDYCDAAHSNSASSRLLLHRGRGHGHGSNASNNSSIYSTPHLLMQPSSAGSTKQNNYFCHANNNNNSLLLPSGAATLANTTTSSSSATPLSRRFTTSHSSHSCSQSVSSGHSSRLSTASQSPSSHQEQSITAAPAGATAKADDDDAIVVNFDGDIATATAAATTSSSNPYAETRRPCDIPYYPPEVPYLTPMGTPITANLTPEELRRHRHFIAQQKTHIVAYQHELLHKFILGNTNKIQGVSRSDHKAMVKILISEAYRNDPNRKSNRGRWERIMRDVMREVDSKNSVLMSIAPDPYHGCLAKLSSMLLHNPGVQYWSYRYWEEEMHRRRAVQQATLAQLRNGQLFLDTPAQPTANKFAY